MKLLLILACMLLAAAGMAQGSRTTTRSILDDGDTLKLKYIVPEKNINYSSQFYVRGWSKTDRDQLVSRILDSLENNSGKGGDTENVSKHISDDGQTMKVEIEGEKNGRQISYSKSFDVKGMTKQQKKDIVNNVLKSLGLATKQ